MLDDGIGLGRRKQHRRTAAERAAIVVESYEPGATVAGVAYKHGIVASPPVSGMLSAALLFLYFSGGRDRTMTWDIHRNARQLC